MTDIYTNIRVGSQITEKWIEKMVEPIWVKSTEESIHGDFFPKHYSCDGDRYKSFTEAIEHATEHHFDDWRSKHEFEIYEEVEDAFIHRLEEENLINPQESISPLTCEWGDVASKPITITEKNIETVEQCVNDAAHDITWRISESLQIYFQTLNPLEWGEDDPKIFYGKDWIEDTQTRLICMIEEISDKTMNNILNNGHRLMAKKWMNGYSEITEFNADGDDIDWINL